MSKKNYTLFIVLIGVICSYVIIKSLFFIYSRPIRTDVVQGFFTGFGIAIVTAQITAKIKGSKVNGWTTIIGCGLPGNGMLLRAACTLAFPGPVNIPKEAMYWTTSFDGSGHELSGEGAYIMHFPAGGLPPNNAFWSLTMGDAKNSFVAPSTFTFKIPLQQVMNPTGCPRPRASSFSGSAYICPARQF